MSIMMVGITGRSGSGKSSVARYYASLGYPVADGDALSRRVCEPGSPCLQELCAVFGEDILSPEGQLLRRKLGERVYADPEGNKRLIAITHPHIFKEMLRQEQKAESAGHALFFMDGAMIVGSMFQEHCRRIILVTAATKLSISRIILRDGISKASASARLAAQMPEVDLRAAADYVIDNNGSQETLMRHADTILGELLEEAKGG